MIKFLSSSSSQSSSYSHIKESVVKKEIPAAKKEAKKSEFEIYEEFAFTKHSVKEPANQSRLSTKDIIFVNNVDKENNK